MKIHYKKIGTRPYYTVLVEPDEVKTHSGKTIPHCWIGTISPAGKINLWRPAGYCPRDYKATAMEMLEKARLLVLEAQKSGNPIIDPLPERES